MEVKLKNVRLGPFPQLFAAAAFKGEGAPAFSALFLIEPGSENEKLMQAAITGAAVEKWGAKANAMLSSLIAKDMLCLHDGVHKAMKYDGFEGKKYVSCRNAQYPDGTILTPAIFDNTVDPATGKARGVGAAEGRVYGGCYVNALINVVAQDNDFGQRVNARVLGVQYAGEGDAFGARTASADDFEAVAVAAGAASNPWAGVSAGADLA